MKKAITFITPVIVVALLGWFLLDNKKAKINFSEELSSILAAIDEEIQLQEAMQDTSRNLSNGLISEISKLANSIVPSKLEHPPIGIDRALSPERGTLLTALIAKRLNAATYQEIFSISTFEKALLENADLSNISLDRILLNQAYFKQVDLSNTSLVGANLYNVHFQNVNLRGANLNKANLRAANLDGSNLSKANLTFAYLREATLKGAQIENAIFEDANLTGVNLNETARGLGNNN